MLRRGRFLYYESRCDLNWRTRAVGTVVLSAALDDAFDRGLNELDFLRGEERYKSLYTSLGAPARDLTRRNPVLERVPCGLPTGRGKPQNAWLGRRFPAAIWRQTARGARYFNHKQM